MEEKGERKRKVLPLSTAAGMSAASQLYSHATCSTVGEHRINAETAGSFGPAYYLSRPLAAIDVR